MPDKISVELETADGKNFRIIKQTGSRNGRTLYEDSNYVVEIYSCPEYKAKGISGRGSIFLQGSNRDNDGENLFISDKRAFISLNKAVQLKVRLVND